MSVLVTGAAGYIGSFMVRRLLNDACGVVALDSLERGHRSAVAEGAKFIEGDIRDKNLLKKIFTENKIDSIIHFAGLISVEESTKNPSLYEEVNTKGSEILFNTAKESGVKKFIFSSSAAVYGNPTQIPIPEDHKKAPTSPYGDSKLQTEINLRKLRGEDNEISFACLRYFNACGADLDGQMGEAHDPETHIIPLAIRAVINSGEFKLFGTDYATKDGTNIRDYIHVLDLVEAHVLALGKIKEDIGGGYFYNVGTGVGISNKEVIETVMKVAKKEINVVNESRRPGDADKLIADATKINEELGFVPKYSDIDTIISSAWKWHNKK